jgi:N-acetylmuramoyl-L-alanine amidase
MSVKKLQAASVKYIAVHCSATSPAADIGVNEIDRWHRNRGFLKVGYHYVIRRDGTLETGRGLDEVGAHVEGFNSESIGVCLVGGVDASKLQKPEDNFTPAQKETLRQLLMGLKKTFPAAIIQGHRDFPNVAKACPSFDVKSWAKKALA